ncbi:NAD(P)-dependent oxidoreductase [Psychrobacillus soli]|uniref:NAD(P)-dependent oxidoreductase n=1 Tax=Psychrobacillus soli TaxID=1543965 RepID=A0A544T8G3_9BACI|nr:NAD(P)-dependent oxidoreductase [Psychrobacillus soli]TQR13755.1 NAD(P)-dependent oxidoreductase [Psychrobacillus soli]
MKIGMIGCGAMGAGIVKNLLKNHHQVWTFDPDPNKQDSMRELGAIPVSSMESVASTLEVIMLSLPLTELVEDAIVGEGGILAHLEKGTYILDMSTTDVNITKKLAQYAKEAGVYFFDCPVSNGPVGAENGTLTIMVGGEREKFETIQPILSVIGKEIRYIGPVGSGQVVKLCNNMVVAGIMVLLSETLVAGTKAGVDAKIIAEVMSIGSAQSKVLSVFGPNLINDTHENVNFLLSHMAKDVRLFTELAKDAQASIFVSPIVDQLFEIAKIQGKGSLDTSAVGQMLEVLSNHKIVN